MDIIYGKSGIMKYNEEFHSNHFKDYTVLELVYLCKHYRRGYRKQLAMDLGRTETTLSNMIYKLKKANLYEHYKNLNINAS
ncbi:DNA-entry nuclease [Bacillus mycoides]|uniref:DNA-entry nuclease n=1 Tax=Bacillus mycoides TaxID=1405 RepID=UPI0010BE8870|nr:DNA-entry nuclease [Bacillus mycoides]TKI38696.1 DNA-entry nuclease [Bacillus mycoides]